MKTKSDFWNLFQKSSVTKRNCEQPSSQGIRDEKNATMSKLSNFDVDPINAAKGEPSNHHVLQKLQVETAAVTEAPPAVTVSTDNTPTPPETTVTTNAPPTIDFAAPTVAAAATTIDSAAPTTDAAGTTTPAPVSEASTAGAAPAIESSDSEFTTKTPTESVTTISSTARTTRLRTTESASSKVDRVTANMSQEEKNDMIRFWRKMFYNKKIPCPSVPPTYLRDKISWSKTHTNELREAFIKERYKHHDDIGLLKNKAAEIMVKKYAVGKDNRASQLRNRFKKQETIYTSFFEQHYELYHKPPFSFKNLVDCNVILKRMTKKHSNQSVNTSSDSSAESPPSPPRVHGHGQPQRAQ